MRCDITKIGDVWIVILDSDNNRSKIYNLTLCKNVTIYICLNSKVQSNDDNDAPRWNSEIITTSQDQSDWSLKMQGMEIVHVSVLERVKLQALSVVYGWYLVVRRLIKWAWNPKQFFLLQPRDKPPPCLVDSTIGKHSYVKLKVS